MSLTKKDSVLNMKKIKKILRVLFWTFFFMEPDFSGSDPDFWPIQTQEKSLKKPGSATLKQSSVNFFK